MEYYQITPQHYVAGQITPTDIAQLQDLNIKTVICNRPDWEVPEPLQAASLQGLIEAAGIRFVVNPVDGANMTLDNVVHQGSAISQTDGAVLAYCTSGTRSALMWAYSQAGKIPTNDIIKHCETAGFSIEPMRGRIDFLADQSAA